MGIVCPTPGANATTPQNLENKIWKKEEGGKFVKMLISVLCRIVPSGSVPHIYRTNLNVVCGSLRYDVVYNLDEDSKNVFKNNVVCMI